jgi:hypothetical protein
MTLPHKRNTRILIIHEDIFRICGCNYIEAMILEMFISSGFDVPIAASVECIASTIFLGAASYSKVQNSLNRLLDKGYVRNDVVGAPKPFNRKAPKIWQLDLDIVERDIKRLVSISNDV